jgi:hypothetical protein
MTNLAYREIRSDFGRITLLMAKLNWIWDRNS